MLSSKGGQQLCGVYLGERFHPRIGDRAGMLWRIWGGKGGEYRRILHRVESEGKSRIVEGERISIFRQALSAVFLGSRGWLVDC